MPRALPVRLAAALLAALLALPAAAQQAAAAASPGAPAERTYAIGVHAGVLFPGTVTVEGYDADTETGFMLRAGADFFLIPKLSLGVFVENFRTSAKDADVDASVVGLGASIIGRFGTPDRPHVRAGLELAYQIDSIDVKNSKDSKGLGLGLFLEGAYPLTDVTLLGRLGFNSQPTGGNADVDVTWAPIFYLAVGVELGK